MARCSLPDFDDARLQPLDLAEPSAAMQVVDDGAKQTIAGCPRDHVVQLEINREMLFKGGVAAGEVLPDSLLDLQQIRRTDLGGGLLSRDAVQQLPKI